MEGPQRAMEVVEPMSSQEVADQAASHAATQLADESGLCGSPRPWCTKPRCEAGASRRLHVELAALEAVRKAARWRGQ
ncbi:hypothetical protein AB1Y20_011497 [Prymnesium parvum]|uniref:Uncharacterized protein n=1 Tax=Prymnesium parvum TaxID=97485 RepID=A0AB34IK68_PRYPA